MNIRVVNISDKNTNLVDNVLWATFIFKLTENEGRFPIRSEFLKDSDAARSHLGKLIENKSFEDGRHYANYLNKHIGRDNEAINAYISEMVISLSRSDENMLYVVDDNFYELCFLKTAQYLNTV